MQNEKKYVIRYSCITGKAVWIYRNLSKEAVRQAYCRARKREEERVRRWGNIVATRKANIRRMLSRLMEAIPVTENLSAEKKKAARQLADMADAPLACDRGFLEHARKKMKSEK